MGEGDVVEKKDFHFREYIKLSLQFIPSVDDLVLFTWLYQLSFLRTMTRTKEVVVVS